MGAGTIRFLFFFNKNYVSVEKNSQWSFQNESFEYKYNNFDAEMLC